MPILGTIASSRLVATPDLGAMFAIQTVSLGANVNSINFSSIPQTYKHLFISIAGRSTRNDTNDSASFQFNGAGGTNYTRFEVQSDAGGSFFQDSTVATNELRQGNAPASQVDAFSYGAIRLWILDYSSTTKSKTFRGYGGGSQNSTARLFHGSGTYTPTTAITSISFGVQSFIANWVAGTTATLYGVKA